jgi:hypothetical protein
MIDDNHVINFWEGVDSDGFAQVFTVNTSTWAVTTAGSVLEFDTVYGDYKHCLKVDANHVFLLWYGNANDLMGQVFAVNTSTWAVTTTQANNVLDSNEGTTPHMVQVDDNHFLATWWGSGSDGYTQIFTVNTSTWAITKEGTALEFDTTDSYHPRPFKIDTNHFIVFWASAGANPNYGSAQVLEVNTTTWAVTTAGAKFSYYSNSQYPDACQIDANHFINWKADGSNVGYAHTFAVNTTTWAVTTTSAAFKFDTQGLNPSANTVDSNHFVVFWQGTDHHSQAQVFEVNTSTYAISTSAAMFEFETAVSVTNFATKIDDAHYINFWYGADGDGFTQVFTVTLPAVASSSVSPTRSASVSSTQSPSSSKSKSESASVSSSQSPSSSKSKSLSASVSKSASASESKSPSASISKSVSGSLSASISKSPSLSESQSESASPSKSPSGSLSASESKSLSASVSKSPSASISSSQSPSASESKSESASVSGSVSKSGSKSESASVSSSQSPSSSVSPSPSPSVLADIYDRTSNHNDLTNNNGVMTYISDAPFVGSTVAANLELSSSQYLSITDANQTGLDLQTDFTIEAWIKLEQLPSTVGDQFSIVAKSEINVPDRSYEFIIQANDEIRLNFYDSSGNTTTFDCDTFLDSYDVGAWVHLAVTVDISVPSATFYINGSAASTTTVASDATSIKNNAKAFLVGARGTTAGVISDYFDGVIDEVRVWNDIRTAQEIADNYDRELTGSEAGLVAYYPFDEIPSPSSSQSPSSSVSPSSSMSPSVSKSISASISKSPSASLSPSISRSISASLSASISSSQSPSSSLSASISKSASASLSPSISASLSPSPSPASWTKEDKTSSTWTKEDKTSSTWTKQSHWI